MLNRPSSLRRRRRALHAAIPDITPGTPAPASPCAPVYNPKAITVMGYGPGGYEEITLSHIDELEALATRWPVVWIDVDGLGNMDLTQSLAHYFDLDRLVMEDIFDTSHFPKVEEYEKYLFMIVKNGIFEEVFLTEQISIVLMEKFVITFQERPGDSFNQLRQRIRSGAGRIRKFGSDYLAYAIIDAVIESYYPILGCMKSRLDTIEDTFLQATPVNIIHQIHDIKNDLLFMHSAIWPIHNITLSLAHDDIPFITNATSHYLRDCQDQAKRVTELSEFYRMIASDLMNTYLAFSDSQANQVMKVLTLVTTIFIPLSFIASLYGMNFDHSASPYNMPELSTRYGYPIVLSVMFIIAVGIIFTFKRKGWIGSHNGPV